MLASPLLVWAEDLPGELTDEAFWKMVLEFSEDGGYFRSDNFSSNEDLFQFVIPTLKQNTKPGGVYLGVGPEQNFTYIVALQPRIAFIFDIRRQNMLEHLMYKAMFEMAGDRSAFMSLLFSRPSPAGLDTASSADALFAAFPTFRPSRIASSRATASLSQRRISIASSTCTTRFMSPVRT
jgi:hypothetical protein